MLRMQMKPRRAEGIILYSGATRNAPTDWFVVELAGGDVRYTCVTSSGNQQVSQSIRRFLE